MDPLRTEQIDGHTINIYQETDAQAVINPREGAIGTLACMHGEYDLGEDHGYSPEDFEGWAGFKEALLSDNDVRKIYPVHLYDRTTLTAQIGNFHGQLPQGHARFDSGQIGFLYVTDDEYENLTDEQQNNLRSILDDQLENFTSYINGHVYRYAVEGPGGERVGGCTGFYSVEDALEDARGVVDQAADAEPAAS